MEMLNYLKYKTINILKKIEKAHDKASSDKRIYIPVFFTLLLIIALSLHYNYILTAPPQSIHRWRQADGLSITLNYYQNGMRFFQPEVHSLTSDGNTTGYAACEAPVMYYFVAALYHITGPNDNVYRIINTLVFFLGLYALFRVSMYFLKSLISSLFVALIVFASPVSAYYGSNYLPDSTALALIFAAWWQLIRACESRKYSVYLFSITLFTLAALLKITTAVNLVSLSLLMLIMHLVKGRYLNNYPVSLLKLFIPLIASLSVIAAWYIYAVWFNAKHESYTFLTDITPLWNLSKSSRQFITKSIFENNLTVYYSTGMLILTVTALIFLVRYARQIPLFFKILLSLFLLGMISYVVLWYGQFLYHDYYFLTVIPAIVLIMICFMYIMRHKFTFIFKSLIFNLLLLTFLGINVAHAEKEIRLRYFGWKREEPVMEAYFSIKPYLLSQNISENARVISIPDATNCYTLYMMNRKGNKINNADEKGVEEIHMYINLGAEYIFINDPALLEDTLLAEFLKHPVGSYKEVSIFRIN